MKYSMGFRAAVVKKTQDGSGRSVSEVARESGISAITITNWIGQYKVFSVKRNSRDSPHELPGKRHGKFPAFAFGNIPA